MADVTKRLRYFDGQVLGAQDFTDEQHYVLDRQRRYSRFLNAAGIVDGLEVTLATAQVTVAPGTALDAQGRQVVLSDPRTVSLADSKGQTVELVIAYSQKEADPQPTEAGSMGNTRFHEEPYVGPNTPLPPGSTVPLTLARLTIDANGAITKDDTVRVYAGVRLPNGTNGVTLQAGPALVVKQDATAYLTIAHDGALTVTGESSFKKKVSIEGNLHLTADQELVFADNGQIRSLDNNHRILFRRADNKLELREFGQIIFSPGAKEGTETAKVVMLANGNVGIGTGTPPPGGKLEVAVTAADDAKTPALVVKKDTTPYLTIANNGDLTVTGTTTLQKPLTVAHGKTGDQIVFAYYESPTNPAGYGHVLKTRHHGGSKNSNAIDFYLWQPKDTPQGTGTLHTMTLEGGNVGIGTGTTAPGGKLAVAVGADDTDTKPLVVGKGTTNYLTMLNDGKVSIGLDDGKVKPAPDPGANLDIGGKSDTAGQVSLQLRSGNGATNSNSNQITFGYNNTAQYRHAIKTRHHSGQCSGNAIDFYVWKYLSASDKDEAGTIGTLHTMTLDGGKVGIGTTTPQMPLHIRQPRNNQGIRLDEADEDGKPTNRYLQIYYEGQGNVVFYHQDLKGQWIDKEGNWTRNSDISLKDEIVNLHNILDSIMQLRPVSFIWKDSQKRDIGFIAQDVEKIFPYLVSSVNIKERNIKGLSYTSFAVLAIAALQEIVRSYDARLTHIEERLAYYQRP